jgi:hypothetical protein
MLSPLSQKPQKSQDPDCLESIVSGYLPVFQNKLAVAVLWKHELVAKTLL